MSPSDTVAVVKGVEVVGAAAEGEGEAQVDEEAGVVDEEAVGGLEEGAGVAAGDDGLVISKQMSNKYQCRSDIMLHDDAIVNLRPAILC